MSIREKINQKQSLAIIGAATIVILSLSFIVWHAVWRGPTISPPVTKAFYSDDDGVTWFVDETTRLAPFDHNGKQAVRAEVFRCKAGKAFVGYLERYSDAAKARIIAAGAPQPGSAAGGMSREPMEVKKPGQTKWVALGGSASSSKEYIAVTTQSCPEGDNTYLRGVSPSDPDNGATN